MHLAVIESPFKTVAFDLGDSLLTLREDRNVEYARALAHHCLTELDAAPWASHLLYTQPGILRDDVAEERTLGIEAGLLWSAKADACVVGFDRGVTAGMRRYGLPRARELGQRIIPVRLGGEWEIDALRDLSEDDLTALEIVPDACMPTPLGVVESARQRANPNRAVVWREMEAHARATTLVHGSRAVEIARDLGPLRSQEYHRSPGVVDVVDVVASMKVEGGVLVPCKVDWAGASPEARSNATAVYGSNAPSYVASQPWSVAHALLWTYTPANPTPMRNKPCVVC